MTTRRRFVGAMGTTVGALILSGCGVPYSMMTDAPVAGTAANPTPQSREAPSGPPTPGAPIEFAGNLKTLNASTDLPQNMLPNQAGQDSSPLFQAALAAAVAGSYQRIIVNPGTYWFKSVTDPSTSVPYPNGHVLSIQNVTSGLVVDFQDSALVFTPTNVAAIFVDACSNFCLKNCTIDFDPLPFTQVRIESLSAVGTNPDGSQFVTATVSTLSGYPALTVIAPTSTQPTFAIDYRLGQRNWNTPRFPVEVLSNTVIQLCSQITVNLSSTVSVVEKCIPPSDFPTNVSDLATGDVLVVGQRTGLAAVQVEQTSQVTLRNVKVYSAYVQGIVGVGLSQFLLANCFIVPYLDSDRLCSVNAGGFVFQEPGPYSEISNNKAVFVNDDSYALASIAYGTVTSLPAAQQLVLNTTKKGYAVLAVGTVITYLDPGPTSSRYPAPGDSTVGQPLGTTTIAAVSTTPTSATITVQDPLPAGVGVGTLVIPAPTAGTLQVFNNRIVRGRFGRGMVFWGVSNANVSGNYIHETHSAGIVLQETPSPIDWQSGGNSNFTLANNVIELACSQVSAVTPDAFAALEVHSLDVNGFPITTMPNNSITVQGNYVAGTPRTGLWYENVNQGLIQNNLLQQTCLLPAAGKLLFVVPSYQQNFQQPQILLSTNVTAPAAVNDQAALLTIYPVGLIVGDGVIPGASANATLASPPQSPATSASLVDSAGTTHPNLAISQACWPIITFQVPSGTALGAAVVTVTSGSNIARGGLFVVASGN